MRLHERHLQERYLELLSNSLLNLYYGRHEPGFDWRRREGGADWPAFALTMVGLKRLNNVSDCARAAIEEGVPGDLIETGVWRGGVCILMAGVLEAYGETDRNVWVCDSFAGVPEPTLPQDSGIGLCHEQFLAVSLDEVKDNFRNYDLYHDNVRFLPGLFKDTLPTIPADTKFAVVRLDGDLYESTRDGLAHLYPKLSYGGYLILDDYYSIEASRLAVDEYRAANGITCPLVKIDDYGAYWQKV